MKKIDKADHHPYQSFESSPVWNALNQAIEDLIRNKDIQEHTKREYIVGYLCKKLWPHLKQVDKTD